MIQIGNVFMTVISLGDHRLLAQEARNSFKIAEAFRPPPGAVAPSLWLQSNAAEFFVWGRIGGQTLLAQRTVGFLNLNKENI
jgi:hypothetical protein